MKKILLIGILTLGIMHPIYAENLITQEAQKITTQEIQNENTYLGGNFLKAPAEPNSKQLITNHKSFLILNIIINGKLKDK